MKYFIVLWICLMSQLGFAQKKIAFVNVNAVVDSCMNKYRNSGEEEIRMMELLLSKKKEELEIAKKDSKNSNEKIKVMEGDIAEFENRIGQRKIMISEDELQNGDAYESNYLKSVKKTAAQLTKKKKYAEYIDISNDVPENYKEEDDLTNEVWLKMK